MPGPPVLSIRILPSVVELTKLRLLNLMRLIGVKTKGPKINCLSALRTQKVPKVTVIETSSILARSISTKIESLTMTIFIQQTRFMHTQKTKKSLKKSSKLFPS